MSSVLVCLLDPLDKLRVFDLKLMKVLTKMQKCQQPLIWVCLKIVYPYTQWFVWSLSLLNGYNWGYTPFSDIPIYETVPNSLWWELVLHCPTFWWFSDWLSTPRLRRCTANRRQFLLSTSTGPQPRDNQNSGTNSHVSCLSNVYPIWFFHAFLIATL
jgi:hypothetical protein